MPELPEVEAARRAIHYNCAGKRIKNSKVADDPKVIDGVSQSELEAALTGKTIVAAHRKGKNLWLQLDSPPFPSFQFGMTGAIYIKGVAVTQYKRSAVSEEEEWPSKYSKVFIEVYFLTAYLYKEWRWHDAEQERVFGPLKIQNLLEDGLEISFTDKRRFARVRLLQDPAAVPPISELGPDAMLEPMKVDEFVDALSKKKVSIKALLLDQSFISGIGNWIADEVLYQGVNDRYLDDYPFRARIHPLQNASDLSRESCESLHRCIKEVIEKAVEVGADSSQYPSNWIFHFREKKAGKAFVDGKRIDFITAGGRTTAYVPELQKLSGAQAQKKARQSKTKKKESDKDNAEGGEPESDEEEQIGTSKSKKSTRASGRSRQQQKQARQEDSDGDSKEQQPKKSAKGATKKQSEATKDTSKKRSGSTKGSVKQKKKARK